MSSLITLNGGTFDTTDNKLNINSSNIILVQNYGISGGLTDISRNMFTIANSSINIENTNTTLGLNNTWTGKNIFKGDISFINTNTIIDASNAINLRSGLVNISGGTISLGSSNIVLPNIQSQKKNNVVFFDTATSALSYGTATSFSDDVSFNNAKTQINSTSVVGLSGGVVNISGGTISLGSSNIVLPNIQAQKKNNVVFFDTTTKALSYGTATSFSDDVSFNNANTQINSTSVIGLSGGTISLGSSNIVLPNIQAQKKNNVVFFDTVSSALSYGTATSFSDDVSFNNANTQINSTSVVGLSGGTINISGGSVNIGGGALNIASSTIVSGAAALIGATSINKATVLNGTTIVSGMTTITGNTIFNNKKTQINSTSLIGLSGGTIRIGSSNVVLPNIPKQSKNNFVYFDASTNALSYGTANNFSNDSTTQVNSTTVIGLSGGVINISGGTISLGSSNIVLPNIQPQKQNNVVFFDTVTNALSYGTATSFSDDVSFNNANTQINSTSVVGLNGGIVNISGSIVNISGGPVNIGAANLASLAVSGNASISGNATLSGETTVSGNATLSGATTLSGETTVSGNATFNNSSTQINSTTIGLSGIINVGSTISNVMSVDTSNNVILQNTLNGLPGSYLGQCSVLSSDGTTLAVSAPNEAENNGVVRIYTRSGTTITLQGTLVATSSYFGNSLAISSDGNTLAVGSQNENSNTGAVRIYTRSSGVWNNTPQGTFTGASTNVFFGYGLAMSSDGNVLVVGSHIESSNVGRVRTYLRTSGSWALQGAALSTNVANANFGFSLSLDASGNTLAVGSYQESTARIYSRANNAATSWTPKGTAITGGTAGVDFAREVVISSDGNTVAFGIAPSSNTGIVRVYLWNGSAWNIQGSALSSGLEGTLFGSVMSMSSDGNVLAVSSYIEALLSGAVRIYKRTNGTWSQIGKTLSTGITGSYFGFSLSITADGNTFAVGAWGENSQSGAVRVYTRNLSSSLNLRGGMISISGDVLDITSNSININSSVVVGSAAPQPNFVLVNPLPQKITTASAVVNGNFGASCVAFSGDGTVMAVGTDNDKLVTTDLGSIVIYVKTNGIWVRTQKVDGDSFSGSTRYGSSIAISYNGNRILVGQPGYFHFGVGANSGVIFVLNRTNGLWAHTLSIYSDPPRINNYFGTSVAISSDGNTAVVGQRENNTSKGNITMYVNNAKVISLTSTQLSGLANDAALGWSVAISSDGTTVATGAFTDTSATGKVLIFTFNGSALTLQQTLTGSSTTSYFGVGVSLSSDGNTLAVGAHYEGTQRNGAVYIYTRSSSTWTLQSKIVGNANYGIFGRKVSLSSDGTMLSVGAEADNTYGASYVYIYSGGIWKLYTDIFRPSELYYPSDFNWGYGTYMSPDKSTLAIAAYAFNAVDKSCPLYVYKLPIIPQLSLAIGDTTTPGKLVVTNKSGGNFSRFQTDTNAEGQTSGIEFGIPAFTSGECAKITSTTFAGNTSDLQFYTKVAMGSESVPRMTISPNGNVNFSGSVPSLSFITTKTYTFAANSISKSNAQFIGSCFGGVVDLYINDTGLGHNGGAHIRICCGAYNATPVMQIIQSGYNGITNSTLNYVLYYSLSGTTTSLWFNQTNEVGNACSYECRIYCSNPGMFSLVSNGTSVTTATEITKGMVIFGDGGIRVGGTLFPNTNGTIDLGGSGNRFNIVYASNGTIQTSDPIRKIIEPLMYGLNDLMKINTIKFKWKKDFIPQPTAEDISNNIDKSEFEYFGVNAVEVGNLFPELVYDETPNTDLGINYSELIPICINGIKELNVKLEEKNASLTNEVALLKSQSASFESQQVQMQAQQVQIQQEQQADKAKIQELENKVAMLEQQNLSFQSQTLSLQSEIMILQNKNSSLHSETSSLHSETSSLQKQVNDILARLGMN